MISTDFYTMRAFRVAKMFGSEVTTIFCGRSYFKMHPFRFLFVYAIVSTTVLAYLMRIVEGPVWYIDSDLRMAYNDFRSFENCVWNTFIMMSTGNYLYLI
jgi:hypothetical protein